MRRSKQRGFYIRVWKVSSDLDISRGMERLYGVSTRRRNAQAVPRMN